MKKIFSSAMIVVMLTAVLHFSIAMHFCGGNLASTRISFSGKLATCGMEDDEKEIPVNGLNLTTHCCENVLSFFGITGNYFPELYSIPEYYQTLTDTYFIPEKSKLDYTHSIRSICTNTGPPGKLISYSVDLSDICILRI